MNFPKNAFSSKTPMYGVNNTFTNASCISPTTSSSFRDGNNDNGDEMMSLKNMK